MQLRMDLRELLIECIVSFMDEHNYNTYNLRKLERANKGNPIGRPIGTVNITTINSILKKPEFIPSRTTTKKLLEFFGIEYTEDINGLKLVKLVKYEDKNSN